MLLQFFNTTIDDNITVEGEGLRFEHTIDDQVYVFSSHNENAEKIYFSFSFSQIPHLSLGWDAQHVSLPLGRLNAPSRWNELALIHLLSMVEDLSLVELPTMCLLLASIQVHYHVMPLTILKYLCSRIRNCSCNFKCISPYLIVVLLFKIIALIGLFMWFSSTKMTEPTTNASVIYPSWEKHFSSTVSNNITHLNTTMSDILNPMEKWMKQSEYEKN